eukprot:1675037-Rhodomonas_salina.1
MNGGTLEGRQPSIVDELLALNVSRIKKSQDTIFKRVFDFRDDEIELKQEVQRPASAGLSRGSGSKGHRLDQKITALIERYRDLLQSETKQAVDIRKSTNVWRWKIYLNRSIDSNRAIDSNRGTIPIGAPSKMGQPMAGKNDWKEEKWPHRYGKVLVSFSSRPKHSRPKQLVTIPIDKIPSDRI